MPEAVTPTAGPDRPIRIPRRQGWHAVRIILIVGEVGNSVLLREEVRMGSDQTGQVSPCDAAHARLRVPLLGTTAVLSGGSRMPVPGAARVTDPVDAIPQPAIRLA